MGSKYEINAFMSAGEYFGENSKQPDDHDYFQVWQGSSIFMALYKLWKFSGKHGCVKLEVRRLP